MLKYCLDANIFINAWNNYPIDIFPTLWNKLLQYKDKFVLIKPIYDEIDKFDPSDSKLPISEKRIKYPLRVWLKENDFVEITIDGNVEIISLNLEKKYEIKEISGGANKNDITLIAYAIHMGYTVVSLEKKQVQDPNREKYNFKIPLICKEEKVECIDFFTMLKRLNISI